MEPEQNTTPSPTPEEPADQKTTPEDKPKHSPVKIAQAPKRNTMLKKTQCSDKLRLSSDFTEYLQLSSEALFIERL